MFKLLHLLLMAIAGLYLLEWSGVIPARQYFPSLPRLEEGAGDVSRWSDAAQWGLAAAKREMDRATAHDNLLPAATKPEGRFTDRVVAAARSKS